MKASSGLQTAQALLLGPLLEGFYPCDGCLVRAGKTFQNRNSENRFLRARDWGVPGDAAEPAGGQKVEGHICPFQIITNKELCPQSSLSRESPIPSSPGVPVSIHNYFPQLSAEMAPVKP